MWYYTSHLSEAVMACRLICLSNISMSMKMCQHTARSAASFSFSHSWQRLLLYLHPSAAGSQAAPSWRPGSYLQHQYRWLAVAATAPSQLATPASCWQPGWLAACWSWPFGWWCNGWPCGWLWLACCSVAVAVVRLCMIHWLFSSLHYSMTKCLMHSWPDDKCWYLTMYGNVF
jgi:hypothetical protein